MRALVSILCWSAVATAQDFGALARATLTLAALRARGSRRYLARWLDPPATLRGPAPPSRLEAIRAAGAIADRPESPGPGGVGQVEAAGGAAPRPLLIGDCPESGGSLD